jgi:hypothetical protein
MCMCCDFCPSANGNIPCSALRDVSILKFREGSGLQEVNGFGVASDVEISR